MHQVISIEPALLPTLREMFDQLGEPAQVLTATSPRPLVVHAEMGQITLIASGGGRISLDGVERPVQAGDLAILSKGCPHAFHTDDRMELRHWHWPQALLDTDREILRERYDFAHLVQHLTHQPTEPRQAGEATHP